MSGNPPFERYPGPPRRDGASYRVISPWRDALAWISIAGRLAITRYLVREEDGWRDALRAVAIESTSSDPLWQLERRDPVELVFTAASPAVAVTATVTVTRERCEIRVKGHPGPVRIRDFIAMPTGAIIDQYPGETAVQISSDQGREGSFRAVSNKKPPG